MTNFDTLRVRVGRRPVTVVELDLDFCTNVYGVAPCAAAVGFTGTQKCFNTYPTCQDTAHYAKGLKTYRFASESSFLPIGETIFPCITDIDLAPVQIDTKGFAVSGSVSVELRDFPYHDRGIDPYVGERTYDPSERGTFFGKLRGRNKYAENRVMRIKEGYVDDDRTIYSRTRTYFIDRIEGPDANGRVRIFGKDALRFADAEKAKAPAVSKGVLSAKLPGDASVLTLVPAGVGSGYPASGTVRVNDEIITYDTKSGDILMGLGRAAEGTESDEHDAGDTVQLCVRYEDKGIPTILYDLFVTYAGPDPQYIPLAEWEDEAVTWLGSFVPSVLLSKPTGVKELLKEIIEGAGLALWWDDIGAQIKFKAIVRPLPGALPPMLNEMEHFLAGSITVKDLPKERTSQVAMYFLPTGRTVDLKAENFRAVSLQVDATGEGEDAYGTSNARTILNRWVPSLQIADEVGLRLLRRYRETPRQITVDLDAKDATLRTGQLVDISSRLVQAEDGAPRLIRCLVTECSPSKQGSHYSYTLLQVADTEGVARLIAPDATPDWPFATTEQRNTYMFISNDAGLMSDGSAGPSIT
ncbi:hypothetical protein [Rhizobium sp. P007]|uniref:hypothetical protein n=1 Tax=Rhizobium sp. P007 TaxID=285908 RepID=UPI001158B0D7|nr:hypothetical protein [Rhizobium sp. P007]CAD7043712.1 hypothetical protein RP007_01060 [Rhizobium sp. P007]